MVGEVAASSLSGMDLRLVPPSEQGEWSVVVK